MGSDNIGGWWVVVLFVYIYVSQIVDPYYFLQYDREPVETKVIEKDGFARAFVRTLVPSFLSMDVDGRVMRIDRSVSAAGLILFAPAKGFNRTVVSVRSSCLGCASGG